MRIAGCSRSFEKERIEAIRHWAGPAGHEMNQPLTQLMGVAEMLIGSSDAATVAKDVAIIHRSAAKLSQIVEKPSAVTDC